MLTSNNQEYLFVYGTLMKRYKNNPFLKEIERYATYQSTAFTTGKLYLIDTYPGFIKTEAFEFVYGELFLIQDADRLFTLLDSYEDFDPSDPDNSLYLREEVAVFTDIKKPTLIAWTYIFNNPTSAFHRIESGDFLSFTS